MTIEEMCKAIRKELGISQYKIADLIGTNQTTVSFIERGFIPNPKVVVAIRKLAEKTVLRRHEHEGERTCS